MAVSTNTTWAWAFVIGACSVLAGISYYRIDITFGTLITTLLRIIVCGVLCYIIAYALHRLVKPLFKYTRQQVHVSVPDERAELFNRKQGKCREDLQNKTDEKVDDYRERILKPRVEAKQQRKEEKLRNVIGIEFSGHGDALGGEAIKGTSEGHEMANIESRDHRQLPASVRLHVPASEGKPVKKKRVIVLPEEPDESEPGVVMVTIHTVLDQRHSRRFLYTTQLQVVFDYMTTLGFSELIYTLAWSHPRQPLTDDCDKTLAEMKFDKRTLLFVQEKVTDDGD